LIISVHWIVFNITFTNVRFPMAYGITLVGVLYLGQILRINSINSIAPVLLRIGLNNVRLVRFVHLNLRVHCSNFIIKLNVIICRTREMMTVVKVELVVIFRSFLCLKRHALIQFSSGTYQFLWVVPLLIESVMMVAILWRKIVINIIINMVLSNTC
jgi:hypothetical protein